LDYNKIIKTIKQKDLQLAAFIPEVTSLTVQGFRKSVANETLKVKDLECITRALGLPMAYWWQDDTDIFTLDRNSQDEVKQMRKKIERQELTIDHLNDQIVELKKRLEGVKTKSAS
jgi:hypothetical protein